MLQSKAKIRLAKPERDAMRRAGQFNAQLMDYIREFVKPGVTTGELDERVHEYTVSRGHRPAPLHYPGEKGPYPRSCCTSINEVICHGIPNDYVLQEGDIVNVDVTSVVDGWHGDSSETFLIGEVSDEARVTQCADCLWLAIRAITPNCPVATIGHAIRAEAEGAASALSESLLDTDWDETFTKNRPSHIIRLGNHGATVSLPALASRSNR